MSWEAEQEKSARLSLQNRFIIRFEQLAFFSEEFQKALADQDSDEEQELIYGHGFANELLAAMNDHLSISAMRQIIDVFQEELEARETERARNSKK